MTNKEHVLMCYPSAKCYEITCGNGSYFKIYAETYTNLIGYSTESEQKAWETAAVLLNKRMLSKFEGK